MEERLRKADPRPARSRWAVAATGSGPASRSIAVAPGRSATFFKLFRDGLIYRGKRLVNWDTMLQTAVSDDEVFHETVTGHFWHFNYPGDRTPQAGRAGIVTIATTRPETMLGDTAVAVHPDPAAALEQAPKPSFASAWLEAAGQGKAGDSEADRRSPGASAARMLPQLEKLPRHGPRRPQGASCR